MFFDIFSVRPTTRVLFCFLLFWVPWVDCVPLLLSFQNLAKYRCGGWKPVARCWQSSSHGLQNKSTECPIYWSAVTSKHWFYFSSSAVLPQAAVPTAHKQSLFSGVVTQPSKYQNMLWFETWCTESQAPEWLWFASKFKKILSFVGYLFTVFKYVWRVF